MLSPASGLTAVQRGEALSALPDDEEVDAEEDHSNVDGHPPSTPDHHGRMYRAVSRVYSNSLRLSKKVLFPSPGWGSNEVSVGWIVYSTRSHRK